ncbi:hypothetical protein ABW19_dt0208304 [Dactylella cylindrospora]|nr:hypothetical protein ABW19_dt0208304 [Dactylella cylindrospora]
MVMLVLSSVSRGGLRRQNGYGFTITSLTVHDARVFRHGLELVNNAQRGKQSGQASQLASRENGSVFIGSGSIKSYWNLYSQECIPQFCMLASINEYLLVWLESFTS